MNDRALIVATLLAGYIANPSNDDIEDERLKSYAYSHADALLAECGEGEPAEPKRVEVTEEKANAIYSLCSQIMKEPIEMYWFCERLSDIINGGDA